DRPGSNSTVSPRLRLRSPPRPARPLHGAPARPHRQGPLTALTTTYPLDRSRRSPAMVRLPRLLFLSTALLATLALGACGADSAAERGKDDTLQVIATFSVINDIAGALGGEEVEVHSIVPIGV